jgi:hypothetical protein
VDGACGTHGRGNKMYKVLVAGSCEYDDEPSGSDATELAVS